MSQPTATHPEVTLTYFDFAASRGEECRIALHVAGVPFRDERLDRAGWAERKDDPARVPFGALPVLTVAGHAPIAQSNTILRLVGRQHDLYPTDPWEAARHDAVMDSVEDLRQHMGPMGRIADAEEKKRARMAAAEGYLPRWAKQVERHIGAGPFLAGAALSVADIKLFVVMTPYVKGQIDHVPPTVFDGAPRLRALFDAVAGDARVKSWYAK